MAVEDLAALTPEELQEKINAYFDSDEGKSYLDDITANTSDEYTKASLEESGTSNIAGALSFVKPLDSDALETWKSQNQVTDDNNNSFLENDQLYQLKVFAASQPKYVPIVPGEGNRRQQRMAEASKTPGAIYSDFGAYSLALQAHNKKITEYVEQEDIPTSVTTPDGVEMSLNLGISPMYYNEQNDGGRVSQKFKNGATGDYYKQLGGVGEYGTYYVKEKKTDWRDSLEASIPFVAAFVGISVIGPAIAAKAAGTSTAGVGAAGELTYAQVISRVPTAASYNTATAGVTSTISNAINAVGSTIGSVASAVSGAIAEGIATVLPGISAEAIAPTIDVLGSITAAATGVSYVEYAKNKAAADAIGGAISVAANGLPGGGVIYSGPGAGGDGVFDPNVISNLTTIAAANNGAAEDEEAAAAIDVTELAAAAIAAIDNPDDDEAVVAANTAVSEAEAGVEEAAGNVATVVEEENAKADGAESYARYVASRYGTRSYSYRNAKKRADKAKLDAQNKINKARTAASVAQAELEDAREAQAGAARDADDAYKSARAQAIRDAEAEANKRRSEIDARNAARKEKLEKIQTTTTTDQEAYNSALEESNTNANNSAAETVGDITTLTDAVEEVTNKVTEEVTTEADKSAEEAKPVEEIVEEVVEEVAEEAKPVVTTSDGTDAPTTEVKYEEPDEPIEVTTEVEPVEKPEDPPLEIEKPVVEKPVEEVKTDDGGGGGGGGGAGEGAGAGQGGDTGADAEVGTTTAAEKTKVETTETTETPAKTADVGLGASEPIDGKWRRDPDDPNGWIHILTGITFEEGQGGKWRNKSTGEVVEEFTEPTESTDEDKELIEVTGAGTGLGGGADTPSSTDTTTAPSETTGDIDLGTPASSTTGVSSTTTAGAAAGTDTTTTATTSTGTAGATTTPTETTTGGAGTGADLGTSDTAANEDQAGAGADGAGTGTTGPADEVGTSAADVTGTGTEVSDVTGTGTGASGTPGVGAGNVGNPGDVGEGTGAGAGTGSGTGSGTGAGEGPGEGSGRGSGRGTGIGNQIFAALMQPQQVQVKAGPVAGDITPYDFSSIFADKEQASKFITPYGVRKAAAGGVIRSDTDTIIKQLERKKKPADTMEDLFRIIGGK